MHHTAQTTDHRSPHGEGRRGEGEKGDGPLTQIPGSAHTLPARHVHPQPGLTTVTTLRAILPSGGFTGGGEPAPPFGDGPMRYTRDK